LADLTNAKEYYEQARRQGIRNRDNEALRLRHLDEVRLDVRMVAEVRLGVKEIPLYRIVGTQSALRGEAFGAKFMPAEDPDTEFARKWMNVCLYHLNEGIADPIKVYEYLGRYYCIEGNKRVSVMKFFGVYSARAEVIRLIPHNDHTNPQIEAFHQWMDYTKTGCFPSLLLTSPFGYRRLRAILRRLEHEGARMPEPREGDELLARFETAYAPYCEEAVMPFYGDAFLEYLQVFGLPNTNAPLFTLSEEIRTIRPQLAYTSETVPADLNLEEEDRRPSFFKRILPKRQPLMVFAYGDALENNEWLALHETARREVQEQYGNRIRTEPLADLNPQTAYTKLSQAAKGADVLFVTSSWMLDTTLRVALENPSCIVMQYSMTTRHHRIHTYFSRYYEAVYLCGMLAGMLNQTNAIGYITPSLHLRQFTFDLNAFALGVRSIRPNMEICVGELSQPLDKNEAEASARLLKENHVDLAIYQNFMRDQLLKPAGTFSFLARMGADGKPVTYMAAPIWNWAPFYSHIAAEFLSGSLDAASRNRQDAPMSYWWGLDSGILNLHMNPLTVPREVSRLVSHMKHDMMRGEWAAFRGPLTDSEGRLRLETDRMLEPEDMLDMHWVIDRLQFLRVASEETPES